VLVTLELKICCHLLSLFYILTVKHLFFCSSPHSPICVSSLPPPTSSPSHLPCLHLVVFEVSMPALPSTTPPSSGTSIPTVFLLHLTKVHITPLSSHQTHANYIRKNPNIYIELYRTIYAIIDLTEPIDISERCLL
jgi:hypothetical protein